MATEPTDTVYTVSILRVAPENHADVADALAKIIRNYTREQILERLERPPWTITKKAGADTARRLVKLLEPLGALLRVNPPLPLPGSAVESRQAFLLAMLQRSRDPSRGNRCLTGGLQNPLFHGRRHREKGGSANLRSGTGSRGSDKRLRCSMARRKAWRLSHRTSGQRQRRVHSQSGAEGLRSLTNLRAVSAPAFLVIVHGGLSRRSSICSLV